MKINIPYNPSNPKIYHNDEVGEPALDWDDWYDDCDKNDTPFYSYDLRICRIETIRNILDKIKEFPQHDQRKNE